MSTTGTRSNIQVSSLYARPSQLVLSTIIVSYPRGKVHEPRILTTIIALVVVYGYNPNAQTLFDIYCKPKPPGYQSQSGRVTFQGRMQPPAISQRTLWSYIVQITSAIKRVHDAGMAVRTIDLTKILVTSQNR